MLNATLKITTLTVRLSSSPKGSMLSLLSGDASDGGGKGPAAARSDLSGRCRWLFASDGSGRGRHSRCAEEVATRACRPEDQGAPRQRCRRGTLRGRRAARDERAQYGRAG